MVTRRLDSSEQSSQLRCVTSVSGPVSSVGHSHHGVNRSGSSRMDATNYHQRRHANVHEKPGDLQFLALDHRRYFETLAVETGHGRPPDSYRTIVGWKAAIYLGVRACSEDGLDVGLLVDEQYGSTLALTARSVGTTVAMPVEVNGSPSFELEYGVHWEAHVRAFEPDYVKLLFRWDPSQSGFPASLARLVEVAQALEDAGRELMLELIPADRTTARLPEAIAEIQGSGIDAAIWKLPIPAQHSTVSEVGRLLAKSKGRAVALGGDRTGVELASHLVNALESGVFTGWVIGRPLWREALQRAARSGDLSALSSEVAANLRTLIEVAKPQGNTDAV